METELAPGVPEAAALKAPAALSKIRHDFKTPLNQIIGYAEMLLEDAAGRAEAETALRRLLDSAQACLEMQSRLLTREPEELRPEHFQELKEDQTARSVYMGEILAELRAEPVSEEWAHDLDRLRHRSLESRQRWPTSSRPRERSVEDSPPSPMPLRSSRHAAVASRIRIGRRPQPGTQPTARTGGRILVVDDNAGNRDMLSRRLEREGYTVDTAENGRQALEKLEAGRRSTWCCSTS